MKIAVLGSASSSLPKAPFKNAKFEEWTQGKLESVARAHAQITGDFQIWGCSPGCWAVVPRATRWFEIHRWEPGAPWFSPEYCQFLRDFTGPVYTGGVVDEFKNGVLYPIDRMEEKFASYNMTSSLALMLALAIDEIELIRAARVEHKATNRQLASALLPKHVDPAELDEADETDMIGLWGVDMAANEEYAFQRPGCQNFVLEAMRRGIGIYLPPESDLMRPMPVYGISEWDHNYIKLTARARELSANAGQLAAALDEQRLKHAGVQGEQHALQYFVSTWTSRYGMPHGLVLRQEPGTGMGSGITSLDTRPVQSMVLGAPRPAAPVVAMADHPDAQLGRELVAALASHAGETGVSEGAVDVVRRLGKEGLVGRELGLQLQHLVHPGESTADALGRVIKVATLGGVAGASIKKAKRRK